MVLEDPQGEGTWVDRALRRYRAEQEVEAEARVQRHLRELGDIEVPLAGTHRYQLQPRANPSATWADGAPAAASAAGRPSSSVRRALSSLADLEALIEEQHRLLVSRGVIPPDPVPEQQLARDRSQEAAAGSVRAAVGELLGAAEVLQDRPSSGRPGGLTDGSRSGTQRNVSPATLNATDAEVAALSAGDLPPHHGRSPAHATAVCRYA